MSKYVPFVKGHSPSQYSDRLIFLFESPFPMDLSSSLVNTRSTMNLSSAFEISSLGLGAGFILIRSLVLEEN